MGVLFSSAITLAVACYRFVTVPSNFHPAVPHRREWTQPRRFVRLEDTQALRRQRGGHQQWSVEFSPRQGGRGRGGAWSGKRKIPKRVQAFSKHWPAGLQRRLRGAQLSASAKISRKPL